MLSEISTSCLKSQTIVSLPLLKPGSEVFVARVGLEIVPVADFCVPDVLKTQVVEADCPLIKARPMESMSGLQSGCELGDGVPGGVMSTTKSPGIARGDTEALTPWTK